MWRGGVKRGKHAGPAMKPMRVVPAYILSRLSFHSAGWAAETSAVSTQLCSMSGLAHKGRCRCNSNRALSDCSTYSSTRALMWRRVYLSSATLPCASSRSSTAAGGIGKHALTWLLLAPPPAVPDWHFVRCACLPAAKLVQGLHWRPVLDQLTAPTAVAVLAAGQSGVCTPRARG